MSWQRQPQKHTSQDTQQEKKLHTRCCEQQDKTYQQKNERPGIWIMVIVTTETLIPVFYVTRPARLLTHHVGFSPHWSVLLRPEVTE